MADALLNIWISFLAGLSSPLLAICVLPLYPAFLVYLSSQIRGSTPMTKFKFIGFTASAGIMISMLILGLVFTFVLHEPIVEGINIISQIAFTLLGIISLLLIAGVDPGRFIPRIRPPGSKNPFISAFFFGFFFGAIVIPCNPASLMLLFAVSTTASEKVLHLMNFISFGLGMSLPILLLSAISGSRSVRFIGFLSKNRKNINRAAGTLMLLISLYYLGWVLDILG